MKIKSFALFLWAICLQACSTVDGVENNINLNLGLSYLQQNQIELAKYRLLIALEQNPHHPFVQDAFAYYLEKTNAFSQAEQHYRLAIRFAQHPGPAKNNYGAFLCRRGKYQLAIDYFLEAAQDLYYLHTANAYENAGVCALKIPDKKQAKIYFSKAIATDPSHIDRVRLFISNPTNSPKVST